MKTTLHSSIVCAALLTVSLSPGLFAQDAVAPKNAPMGRVDAMQATLTAEVTAINLPGRKITLKDPQGNVETVTVSDAVKRLNEVKVGDSVRLDYLISVVAELREPTPEEAKNPLVILDAAGRAPADSAPAGGVARQFKVVTTIEGLDRPSQTVTVKGPLGRYFTARVADPARLTKVHIGDTIVIVYTEALAISLEKVQKKTAE
jgi:hypothetical protein